MVETTVLSPEKRAQILRGAAAVFAQDGYEGASMSRIAVSATVSKGTLYNYFDSKADLFAAHLHDAFARSLSHFFEQLGTGVSLEAALGEIGRRMIGMILSPGHRAIYRMVIAEAEKFPELARAFYEAGPARGVETLAAWIATQVTLGTLQAEDCTFAAEQFFALCQTRLWMRYRLHLPQAPCAAEIDQVVDGAVGLFLCRYRTQADRPR